MTNKQFVKPSMKRTAASSIFSDKNIQENNTQNTSYVHENNTKNTNTVQKNNTQNNKKPLHIILPVEQINILKEAARLTNRTMTQLVGDMIIEKYRGEWKELFTEMKNI